MLVALSDPVVVKRCGCGHSYTLEDFRRLPFVGAQRLSNDGKRPEQLELRQCGCGTSLAIGIDRNGNWQPDEDDDDLCE
ncbi:hypothetical protein LCGC14_2564070 [marine sediment metagenome]|uniref:Uncharacterized protein n=1 Tax=marine sediment metagenome TaxID=412755 RepID=A0A0F9B731_9ZZZZ